MFELFVITFFVVWGIYHLTNIDFEVGNGFSEEKTHAKEVECTVRDLKMSKDLPEKKEN